MRDREEPYREDPLAVGRGIGFGLAVGGFMWILILAALYYLYW